MNPRHLLIKVFVGLIPIVGTGGLAKQGALDEPTFLIFKYQHIVGKETDTCSGEGFGERCQSHFQLDFTGASISLDAEIKTDRSFQPISYSARGQNSTRSSVDLSVTISGQQAAITDNGVKRVAVVPPKFFTLQEDVPFITQQLLLAYWRAHGKPESISLLPAGRVSIRLRGTNQSDSIGGRLTRYTVHGVTWGNETIWLNEHDEVAAIVGADAEEDRVEVVRPRYEQALKAFVNQAAADAVEDLELAAKTIKPIASGTFALTHATVIDPSRDRAILNDATILIRGGKIAEIGSNLRLPPSIRVLDATGKFILPGLWDTHAHFEQSEWGPAYLACGITSVRDVGNEIEFLVPIRNSLNAGRSLGPRMYAAGLIDSDPGSLTSEHAEGMERARAIVQRYHDLGYQEIKIYQSLKPDLIPVVTVEAHRLGMKVTGHIPTGTDALSAVRNGMDMINHISFVTRVMRLQGTTSVRTDSPEAKSAIQLFLERGTIIEPTLARSEFNLPQRRPFSEFEPSVMRLPPELAVILNHAGIDKDREDRAAAAFQVALDTTKSLQQSGVPLLAGSDQVVPGASLHRELELLVRAGLTPLDAIRSATMLPTKILGVTDSGSIEVGKRADLVVLDASPLENIRNIRSVRWTIVGGTPFDSATLWRSVDVRAGNQ
jgi:imidazolonepropionase-like amidohydrolase